MSCYQSVSKNTSSELHNCACIFEIKMELREKLKLPSNWTHQSEEVVKVNISPGTSEYNRVKLLLSGTALSKLTSIYRIQNPYLFHRYLTRKLEYQARNISFTEQTLLHATADNNIDSIIQDNLDYRLVRRAKFGKGVSFSPCATYANAYCTRSNGNSRAMIVAKVLVGSCMSGRENLTIPTVGIDTTTGNSKKVFVKYYDDEFYPEYVAYYTSEIVYRGKVRHFDYDDYFDYVDPQDSYDNNFDYDDLHDSYDDDRADDFQDSYDDYWADDFQDSYDNYWPDDLQDYYDD